MADEAPIGIGPDYMQLARERARERAKKGIKLQPAESMTPQPTPQIDAEEPQLPHGFWESVKASHVNPWNVAKGAYQELVNWPQSREDISRAVAAGMRIRKGKGLPGDQELVDKAMQVHLGGSQPEIIPAGAAPAALAGVQLHPAGFGPYARADAPPPDPGGALGTLLGAGATAAEMYAATRAIPPVYRGGRKIVVGGAKGAYEAATAPGTAMPVKLKLPRVGAIEFVPKRRIYGSMATGATLGTPIGTAAGSFIPGVGPAAGGGIGFFTGAGLGGGKVVLGGAVRGALKELRGARPRPGPVWEGITDDTGGGGGGGGAAPAEQQPVVIEHPSGRAAPTPEERITRSSTPPPPPARPAPAWQGSQPPAGSAARPAIEPIVTPPPSGRKVPTPEERMARAASPVEKTQATTSAAKTPGQVYAEANGENWADLSPTDRQYMENIATANANVAAQEAERAARPPATPPPPPPDTPPPPPAESKSFAQETEERMREHLADAEKETPPPPPKTDVPPPDDLAAKLEESIAAANAKKAAAKGDTPPPPPPKEGGRLYSKTKDAHTELTSQIHALGQELDLPGSPAGKHWSVTPTVKEVYGPDMEWNKLSIDQKSALTEFVNHNRRPPTAADVESGAFDPRGGFAAGGAVNFGDSPSQRIAAELRNQGLTSAQAGGITPDQWGDLSRAAGVSAVGQYSVEDTLRHMKKLEEGLRRGGPLRKAAGGTTRSRRLTPSQEQINQMLGTGSSMTEGIPEDTTTIDPWRLAPAPEEEPQPVPKVKTPLPEPYRGKKPSITQEVLSTFSEVPNEVAGLEGTKGLVDPQGAVDEAIRNYTSIGKGVGTILPYLKAPGRYTPDDFKYLPNDLMSGASDVGRGGFGLAAPFMPGWAAAAGISPASFFSGLAGGVGSQKVAEEALKHTDLPSGTQAGLADVAGLAGGIGAGHIPGAWEAVRSMPPGTFSLPEFNLGSERGSITLGPREQPVGFFGPDLPPAERGKLPQELAAEQRQVLTPQEWERYDQFKQQYPEAAKAFPFMTGLELKKTLGLESNVESMNRLMTELPNARKIASTALFGEPKRGWYRASAQAIMDVFGKHDAPRFTALLAAMSPQTSVESNLFNTLNVWKEWNAAGRPQDAQAILDIMGRSVQGIKGNESVLHAWRDNAIGALQSNDPLGYVLSGPKVDSFFRNLGGDVRKVTNDAWIAAGMRRDPDAFSGARGSGQDPGFRPGYIGPSVVQRMAGHRIGFHPDEVQESIWSVFKPAYEMQEKTGIRARDLVQQGLITPEAIRAGSPDFSTLMKNDPTFRNILEQSGYGEQIERMPQYQWPDVTPSLTRSQQNDVLSMMEGLEKLRGERAMESRAIQVPVAGRKMPSRTNVYETTETAPGAGTGHLEDIGKEPYTKQQAFHSRIAGVWKDPLGQDILTKSVGLPSLEARPATGAWVSQGTQQLENHPASALGTELRIPRGWDMSDYDKIRMDAIAALRAGATAQLAGAYSGFLPQTGGLSAFFPRAKKVPLTNMQAAATHVISNLRAETGALADVGGGTHYLNFSGQALPEASLEFLARQLSDQDTLTRFGKEQAAAEAAGEKVPTAASLALPGKTIGNVIGMEKAWRQEPGSNQVFGTIMQKINQLHPEDYAELDRNIRVPFGKLVDEYNAYIKSRGYPHRADLMNVLVTGRDHGLRGIQKGIDSGALFPAAAGAVLLPALHSLSQQDQD